jgi:hypothetical protein
MSREKKQYLKIKLNKNYILNDEFRKKKTKKRLKNLKELKIKTYIKREGIEKTKQKIKKGANFFLYYMIKNIKIDSSLIQY